jgi:hypothetical protein
MIAASDEVRGFRCAQVASSIAQKNISLDSNTAAYHTAHTLERDSFASLVPRSRPSSDSSRSVPSVGTKEGNLRNA